MQETETLPLFPLGLVLFPGMILPLHIFEERYKLMISECLEQNKKFGIVYYKGDKVCNTGCSARVINITQKYVDGSMDILTEGMQRFNIQSTSDSKPYLEAKVIFFDDVFEVDIDGLEIIKGHGVELLKEIMKISTEISIEEKDLSLVNELDAKDISFLIASLSGFSFEEKQAFLELINTRERIEKGLKSLQIIRERLIMTKDIDKIIRGNGYLPHKN